MNKIAFLLKNNELPQYASVIKCLPTDLCDIYLETYIHKSDAFMVVERRKLKNLGYNIINILSESKKREFRQKLVLYSTIVCVDSSVITYFSPTEIRKLPCISLPHATSAANSTVPCRHQIFSYENAMQGLVTKKSNPKKFEEISMLPIEDIDAAAYSGPYQIDDWTQKRHSSKEELHKELEEFVGQSIDKNKPIVAFFDEHQSCLLPDQIKATQALASSEEITFIAKFFHNDWELPKNAIIYPTKAHSANLLRFSADYVLAGFQTGTLASSLMYGLNVIPYHTNRTHHSVYKFMADNQNVILTDYKEMIKGTLFENAFNSIENFEVNINDTQALLNRIKDANFWKNYHEKLPEIQKSLFGNYLIEGAAQKTASLIIQFFGTKSFGNDEGIAMRSKCYLKV